MRLTQQVRKYAVKLACWIFKKCEIDYVLLPDSAVQDSVSELVAQVEEKFKGESGEFKRAQVMRAVMNQLPKASERDIAFAIEVEIRKDV